MSNSSCRSARQGSPANCISAATSAPADSAASSRPIRFGSGADAMASRCIRNSRNGSILGRCGFVGGEVEQGVTPARAHRHLGRRGVPGVGGRSRQRRTRRSAPSAEGSHATAAGRRSVRPARPRPAAPDTRPSCRPTPTADAVPPAGRQRPPDRRAAASSAPRSARRRHVSGVIAHPLSSEVRARYTRSSLPCPLSARVPLDIRLRRQGGSPDRPSRRRAGQVPAVRIQDPAPRRWPPAPS